MEQIVTPLLFESRLRKFCVSIELSGDSTRAHPCKNASGDIGTCAIRSNFAVVPASRFAVIYFLAAGISPNLEDFT